MATTPTIPPTSAIVDVAQNVTEIPSIVTSSTCRLNDWRKIVLMTGFLLVFIIGLAGNAYVIYAFGRRARKGHRFDLLVVYLAICDIFASIVSPTLFLYWEASCNQRWDFGLLGCKVIPALSRITIDISIGVVLIMAIDRCVAVALPHKRLRRVHLHWAVAASVLLSVVWESYVMHAQTLINNQCIIPSAIAPHYAYPLIVMTLLRDILFISIFGVSTALIFWAVRNSKRKFSNSVPRYAQHSKLKTAKLLIAIAVVFGILVLPRDIYHVTFTASWMDYPHSQGIKATRAILDVNMVLKLLQVSNSCVNVFIYGLVLGNSRNKKRMSSQKYTESTNTLNNHAMAVVNFALDV